MSNIFTIKVNPISGKKEWVPHKEHYDYFQQVARSSYADMLHDKQRNEMYYSAIKKAVKTMKESGRLAKVLDIGTGTGLLSMMAARCGADSIVACEEFPPVAKCAQEVIKDNGYADKIKIILKNSCALKVGPGEDLEEKANILVSEVFDTELIGEGALKTFKDALETLLEPDSIVIPSAASIYVQIVDSPMISAWNKIKPVQVDSDKVVNIPSPIKSCPGLATLCDIQLSQVRKDQYTAITEPICVFEFDFTGRKSIEMNETFIKQVTAIANGSCEVVFMWWCLKMDKDGDEILNNGPSWQQPDPNQIQWRDHWMQGVYYLPQYVKVSEGDRMTFMAFHDEFGLWFTIDTRSVLLNPFGSATLLDTSRGYETESPTCNCIEHIIESRLRIGMKNDQIRNSQYADILKRVITPSSVCLCVSDGSHLPVMAAKLGAKKVFVTESGINYQNIMIDYMYANDVQDVIKLIKKPALEVTQADLENEKIDVLISEPYFGDVVRPWELMTFWNIRRKLAPFLKPDVSVIPESGILKAMGVKFDNLWKIRAPVVDAEGFSLSKFDEMIQRAITVADCIIEPHPLWEYPCKPVTEAFDLLKFDFVKNDFKGTIDILGDQPIISDGTCNAVVLWTEYDFQDVHIPNGPIGSLNPQEYIKWYVHAQQGVHFIHPPAEVTKDGSLLNYNISMNITYGEFSVSFTVQEK